MTFSLVLYSSLIYLLFLCSISIAYDIAIYEATPAGISAAVTAARVSSSFSIVIIEPTPYIGGTSTAAGIGLRDLDLEITIKGSIAQEWVSNNYKYYKNVSNPIYQPDMNGTSIVQIITANNRHIWKASVWIDASYEGDLVPFSDASVTWGRESGNQYNESLASVQPFTTFANFIPNYPVNATLDNGTLAPYISPIKLGLIATTDLNMMGYSYRLCITPTKKKQAPFIKPLSYDPNNFVILQRYINSLIISGQYPYGDKFDMCDSFGSAFISDAINLNQNYINDTVEDRIHIAQNVSDYSGPAFEIPYSILLPKRSQVTNLLVRVFHAATRVEPHFMLLDGASGYAAAYSILDGNIDVQPVNIKQIQQILINDGVLLHYPQGHCNE
ncbi:unnamed protein product [Adineta steineri]|uniref:FAD dependent oxidoreductase n=1 Tax=Adineta steineri TaxID=433720 RepID=A0A814T5F7_9BILA|nr:unnamed protein product [Adineta steineri]CAF1212662.1 unnamed protein product [Adineta steineri]CAF4184135.1 unnamed protein product [Adineta steineri]CAF4217596.1 unnamed protein product [Adineta steineri]